MGNKLQRINGEEADDKQVLDLKKIYWDSDGNLRHDIIPCILLGKSTRNRDAEILKALEADSSKDDDCTKLWMIVPSRWIRKWLLFTHFKIGEDPGPIDMLSLLVQDINTPGGWRPKNTLRPPSTKFGEEHPGHYRRITLEAWISLIDLYNLEGYALAVRGTPFDDVTRWRVFRNPRGIDINFLPEPILPVEDQKKPDEPSTVADGIKSVANAFGLGMLISSSNSKPETKPSNSKPTATTANNTTSNKQV